VGVEPYEYYLYSNKLKAALIESQLFDRVDDAERIRNPTLIARIEQIPEFLPSAPTTFASAMKTLPTALTIVSFGLIPSFHTEEYGYAFSLRRPEDPDRTVLVETMYSGRQVIGWYALIASRSPDYLSSVSGSPEESERFRLFLQLATAKGASELLSPGPLVDTGKPVESH